MKPTEWAEALGKADATSWSAEVGAAFVILSKLKGYNKRAHRLRQEDAANLANALEGYAILLQRHGVKVHEEASLTDLDEALSKFP